ncbi:hypothetical protein [Prosthecobacter sp.]|uniref:hypothetical protein n=1 Tax=Prosthecobacter sp. TaxID=1965333 RepID=UPI002487FD16|nr:hypothetical protein [Prosthecobacter sp.]MDI1310975.1 hypothetical protein [Prosthecobacter sp.]
MIWRVAAMLAVIFWAVMSGLLVRDIYFPEASRFAIVPPRMVMDLFLRQSETFGCTLHLYHQSEKIGHANLQVNRRIKQDHQTVYELIGHGAVEEVAPDDEARSIVASWRLGCTLADGERWQNLAIKASFPQRDASMRLSWNETQSAPEVLVKEGERVVMNSEDVKLLMGMGGGQNSALAMLSLMGASFPKTSTQPENKDAMKLQAREGMMMLAGRQRKCFVLTLPIMGMYEVKMIFTEAGELARIDLPDDYVLLEPTIHGLQDAAH